MKNDTSLLSNVIWHVLTMTSSKSQQVRVNIKPKIVTSETKLKISLRCQGLNVKVFFLRIKSNNLVKQFSTITSAALHFGMVSPRY